MATFHFAKTHEYIKEDGGAYYLGISDHAQGELGDITYVELPTSGAEFAKGEVCCTVESVKAVAEIYAPIPFRVVEANDKLEDEPETVNSSPMDEGWLIKIKLLDANSLGEMLDQNAYDALDK